MRYTFPVENRGAVLAINWLTIVVDILRVLAGIVEPNNSLKS